MRTGLLFTGAFVAGVGLAALVADGSRAPAGTTSATGPMIQDQGSAQHQFSVNARKYAFTPDRLEVQQDDLVKITLQSDDIAHSLTIDAYRIARRVGPGQSTTFEFRADKAGTFPFYCNLAADEGCRQMRGDLLVRPR